jgi:hypothetical protein
MLGTKQVSLNEKAPMCGAFAEPSDGLEPSTPSLPWNAAGNQSQPTATVFAYLSVYRTRTICDQLPPVATAGLHKGSILRCLFGLRASSRSRPPSVAAIKQQMRPLLEWGSTGKRQRHVRALAKNLLKLWPALWTFADVPDVEPTNNAAERGLRAAVVYRKLSFGSRSQDGERTIERLLSVDQTCRLQCRSLYAYLADVLAAKARGDPVPALS